MDLSFPWHRHNFLQQPQLVSACHYKIIVSNALKTLHLLCHVLSPCHSPSTKILVYTSPVRSKLSYYSQVWQPHLIKDIIRQERIQRKSTKFILNIFNSSYKVRLIKLKFVSSLIMVNTLISCFSLNVFKNPQHHFSIFKFVVCLLLRTPDPPLTSNLNPYFHSLSVLT